MLGDTHRGVQSRVMYPENATVVPHLTLAMNDESLYGFIEPGHTLDVAKVYVGPSRQRLCGHYPGNEPASHLRRRVHTRVAAGIDRVE
jgi:hypothetical protein